MRLHIDRPQFSLARPEKQRAIDQIDAKLRETVQGLVNARAPWPLFLYGEAGAGKTCCALVMLDTFGGVYGELPRFCQELLATEQGHAQWSSGYPKTTTEFWQQWTQAQLIVMDELGARTLSDGRPSPYENSALKTLIDRREGMPAVYLSNFNLEGIAQLYGDPIASRLSAGTRFQLDGDRRQQT